MQFRVLGNLEVLDGDRPVAVGGVRPKATLAFLLLHSNSVVPISRLLKAVWPSDTPATGRKMLHNAVSRLRGILDARETQLDCPILLTHSPGYYLRVPPEALDLIQFQHRAAAGHAQLAAGEWERAATTLWDALNLWRGPALVDLTEGGIDWPELAALENSKLGVLEDWVEAQLALGRYAEVIRELEPHVGTASVRERMTAQLMRALYHSGRQSDALALYQRTRTTLVERFGLDPSPVLRDMELAILNHEMTPVASVVLDQPVDPPIGLPTKPLTKPRNGNEHTRLTVAIVLAFPGGAEPGGEKALDEHVADVVRTETERCGGTVAANLGALWLIISRAGDADRVSARCVVQAASAIRDRLRARPELAMKIAVATGDTLVRQARGAAIPRVAGGAVNAALALLNSAEFGEVSCCPATASIVGPVHGRGPSALLRCWHEVQRLEQSHLVTVLGDESEERDQTVDELRVASNGINVLLGRVDPGDSGLGALAETMRAYLGLDRDDSTDQIQAKLVEAINQLPTLRSRAEWVSRQLHALLVGGDAPDSWLVTAWSEFLVEVAAKRPTVVVVQDLHFASDVVLDIVNQLAARAGAVALLVVVTANTDLVDRVADWCGFERRSTITLRQIGSSARQAV